MLGVGALVLSVSYLTQYREKSPIYKFFV